MKVRIQVFDRNCISKSVHLNIQNASDTKAQSCAKELHLLGGIITQ